MLDSFVIRNPQNSVWLVSDVGAVSRCCQGTPSRDHLALSWNLAELSFLFTSQGMSRSLDGEIGKLIKAPQGECRPQGPISNSGEQTHDFTKQVSGIAGRAISKNKRLRLPPTAGVPQAPGAQPRCSAPHGAAVSPLPPFCPCTPSLL